MTELFEMLCPTYMAYGMTWEQYWFGDPWMVRDYQDAYILKRRMHNEDMWVQGFYNYTAFQAVLATAFGKTRVKYVEKPYDIFPKTEMEKKQEKVETKRKLIKFLNSLIPKKQGDGQDGKP